MNREEERGVIARILAGDTAAFESLVLANQRKVHNHCLRMTGDAEDAEDLAQEAFLKAYRNLANFKGESSFATWLYRLTSNVCIDHLRREKRRASSALTYIDDDGQAVDLELPDTRFEPAAALERKITQERIQQGLDGLSEDHRAILILRELNGLSYEEIATALHLSSGTVKSRIARARQAMCKFLLHEGNNFEAKSSYERVD